MGRRLAWGRRSRPFADRADAGRELAAALGPSPSPGAVVCGLARGGVPVAAAVADAWRAQLDVLVVRKIGHPRQPEYALGAVTEDGVVLPPGLPLGWVQPATRAACEQAHALRGGRERIDLRDRAVVLVDDGLATGRSMAAAIASARQCGAARVAVAVPVAAAPALDALAEQGIAADAVVVAAPGEFVAVGGFYEDFTQTSDSEVAAILRAGRTAR